MVPHPIVARLHWDQPIGAYLSLLPSQPEKFTSTPTIVAHQSLSDHSDISGGEKFGKGNV
jgi:hypothetical protein